MAGGRRPPEFFLYLPQMQMEMGAVVDRARAAEAAGFTGIAFMDHLAPPRAGTAPLWEAVVTATWVLARTERLLVGHLVLCDSLRHPAVLAKAAVTLDLASGGRFELGLGSGSVPGELAAFGVSGDTAAGRTRRLGETLEVVRALWSGEPVDFEGEYFRLDGARQLPVPGRAIPIVVGGSGPGTLELARRHGTWWNLPVTDLDRLGELAGRVAPARVSTQHLVGFVAEASARPEVEAVTARRFGGLRSAPLVGDGPELARSFGALAERGVERFYVWFSDFATPETLARFGTSVIGALGGVGAGGSGPVR